MGRAGPKKEPAAKKRAKGTYRKDRDAGVELPAGVPPLPDWLGEHAREEWSRRAPQLAAAGLISELDQVTFALYCQAFEQLVLSLREVEQYGFTSVTDSGNVIQHPVVAVMHKARSDLLKLAREFGMTPSARCGLKPTGGDEPDDPLSAMEKERH